MVAKHAAAGNGQTAAARLMAKLEPRGWLVEEPAGTLGCPESQALRLRGLSTLWNWSVSDPTAETRDVIASVPAAGEAGLLFATLWCQFEFCEVGPVEVCVNFVKLIDN